MDSNKLAPLVIVILGSLCAAFILIGPVMVVWEKLNILPLFNGYDGTAESEYHLALHAGEKEERRKQAAALGLDSRYEIHRFVDGIREGLYQKKDFEAAEAALAALYEQRADPLMAHRYFRSAYALVEIENDVDPDVMQSVLDAWVDQYTDSYRARFLRGRFLIEYGWHVQLGEYGDPFRGRARRLLQEAEADLNAAHDMNPEDPNASAALIMVAMGLEQGQEEIERHFQNALAADHNSLVARYNKLNAVSPEVGGSWEAVDAVVAEAQSASVGFPLLGVIARYGARKMVIRGPEYVAALNLRDTKLEFVQPYMAQLNENPDDLVLLCNAAYYAFKADEYSLAEPYFREIGDRFHEAAGFRDLMEFNDYRAFSRAMAAEAAGEPYLIPGLLEALEIAPSHYYPNFAYGRELMLAGDYVNARRYLERAGEFRESYAPTWVALAEMNCFDGKKEEAVTAARKVLALDTSTANKDAANAVLGQCGS